MLKALYRFLQLLLEHRHLLYLRLHLTQLITDQTGSPALERSASFVLSRGHQITDIANAQPQGTGSADKLKASDVQIRVKSITRIAPAWTGHQPLPLVETNGLRMYSGLLRQNPNTNVLDHHDVSLEHSTRWK